MRKSALYLLIIVFLVLAVQLIAINRPYRGNFASYQATIMASIGRNMVRENFSEILLPKTDAIIGGDRSLHLNQYPFPAVFAAAAVKLIGGNFEFWGRFQAILFNLLTALFLGLAVSRLFDPKTGWLASGIYLLSPFTIIYGQSFLSESMALFFFILSFYLLTNEKKKPLEIAQTLFAGLCYSISITGRFHFVFFFPVFLILLWNHSRAKLLPALIFTVSALAIPIAWTAYTYSVSIHAPNVHTNFFVQLESKRVVGANLLLSPDFYRRMIDLFSQTIMTPLLFPFLFLGWFLLKENRSKYFWLFTAALGVGIFMAFAFPKKVMALDFYFYPLYPFLAIFAAFALRQIIEVFPVLNSSKAVITAIVLYFLVSARFFAAPVFSYPSYEREIPEIAPIIEKYTQPEERVIVAGKDTALMSYYANRPVFVMNATDLGQELPDFLKNAKFRGQDLADIQALEEAKKDPVKWVQYYQQQGARYWIARRSELALYPGLADYFLTSAEVVQQVPAPFILYRLK